MQNILKNAFGKGVYSIKVLLHIFNGFCQFNLLRQFLSWWVPCTIYRAISYWNL